MDTEPLPLDFWTTVGAVIQHAQRTGKDPAEELNRSGLLLTRAQDKRIRLEAMNYLLLRITSWRPAEFMRRINEGAWTPTAMYREIVQFIEEHIREWEREQ